jgi:ribonuclease E
MQVPAFEAAPEPAPAEALLADLGQAPAAVPEPAPTPVGESAAAAQPVQQALFAVCIPEVTVPVESTPTPELSSPEETIATSLAATLPVTGAIPAAPVREIKLDLEAAGLVLVETKHDIATSFADQVEELEPRRPRRTRQRPQPPLASEPLVQVETHK